MDSKKVNNKPSNSKINDFFEGAKGVLGVIGTILLLGVIYIGWVNSGSNNGNFFGLAFRMPLETTDHYCWRRSDRVFTSDTDAYEKCMTESNSERHQKIINYAKETFVDETGSKTVITSSQAECMANKIENSLTDKQIDKLIEGGNISDEISASTATQLMSDIINCAK